MVRYAHLLYAFGCNKVNNLVGHAEVFWGHVAQDDAILGEKSG